MTMLCARMWSNALRWEEALHGNPPGMCRLRVSLLYSLGQALDERRWLGFSIWTFVLCSLSQRYGQAFLSERSFAIPTACCRAFWPTIVSWLRRAGGVSWFPSRSPIQGRCG